VIQSLSDFSADDYVAYGVEVNHREAVAVIVNLAPDHSGKAVQRRVVSTALTRLREHRPSTPSVAVGLVHPGTRGITNSYVEAMAASEYTAVEKIGLQFFADITGSATRLPRLPVQLRLRLLHAVKEGQVGIAMATLDDIGKTVSEVAHNEVSRLTYFRDLAEALLDIPGQLGLEDEIEPALGMTDELDGLATLVQFLCRVVIVDRSSSADRLVSHVVEFVEQNYGDGGLSLVFVADRFGTSLSHLSRVFKEHTGKTFSEYIGDLRIERMKALLRSTDLTVREIVSKVGYRDVPNCIRKFRIVVGETPGKYRRRTGSTAAARSH